MDLTKAYLERIPIRAISLKKQQPFFDLVDEMLELKRKQLSLIVDFERYWEPLVDQITLRYFYDRLPVEKKQLLDRMAKGSIKNVSIEETQDWLTLSTDYSATEDGEKKNFRNVPVLKLRIENEAVRKFIFHVINNRKKSQLTGNLCSKILSMPIPRFDRNEAKNTEAVRKVMNSYLKALGEKEKIDTRTQEIDEKIDRAVFDLFDLAKDEIEFVKRETNIL
jgi:hypothetical protein